MICGSTADSCAAADQQQQQAVINTTVSPGAINAVVSDLTPSSSEYSFAEAYAVLCLLLMQALSDQATHVLYTPHPFTSLMCLFVLQALASCGC
jgi:hypothetical protein